MYTSFELDGVDDLSSGNIELNSVIDGDFGVGESESSTVVGDNVGDLVGSDSLLGDLAELVLTGFSCLGHYRSSYFSFFGLDVSEDESSLNVVEDSV